jgi:hypothetical protein
MLSTCAVDTMFPCQPPTVRRISAADDLSFAYAKNMGDRFRRSNVGVVLFPFALCIIYHLLAFLCGMKAKCRTGAAQMHGARLGDGLADAAKVCTSGRGLRWT